MRIASRGITQQGEAFENRTRYARFPDRVPNLYDACRDLGLINDGGEVVAVDKGEKASNSAQVGRLVPVSERISKRLQRDEELREGKAETHDPVEILYRRGPLDHLFAAAPDQLDARVGRFNM